MLNAMRAPASFATLRRIEGELRTQDSIFGIHRSLFWRPERRCFVTDFCGLTVAAPVGPAAGPHARTAWGILSAWLCGARCIELSTRDGFRIDAEDEGYHAAGKGRGAEDLVQGCAAARKLIPEIEGLLGWEHTETALTLSVGPGDAALVEKIARAPDRLVDGVVLAPHGCRAEEVLRAAQDVWDRCGLPLFLKLSPALLGRDEVLSILQDALGSERLEVLDWEFDEGLRRAEAVDLIRALNGMARRTGRAFGVRLAGPLAVRNWRRVLPGGEIRLSGRALYPVVMQLWNRLHEELGGDLRVVFSGGADAENAAEIFSCGAAALHAATDLLKPGGCARLGQYLENLESAMRTAGAADLRAFGRDASENLRRAAKKSLSDPRYKKERYPGAPKIFYSRPGLFDCIAAPCTARCPLGQDVPALAGLVARRDAEGALAAMLCRNPIPNLTGRLCDHPCQSRCTRAHYDEAVDIRVIERFAAGQRFAMPPARRISLRRVAVVGGGPSGLSAAWVLARAGVKVTVFEARDRVGGMAALDLSRLPEEALACDVERIRLLGVEIVTDRHVADPEALLESGAGAGASNPFDAVYVAAGFPRDVPLEVEGAGAEGVMPALAFLEALSRGERPGLGKKALVIGGGNLALESARAAMRLTGGPVTVVWERERDDMTALGEIQELALAEGVRVEELVSPLRVLTAGGRVTGLECGRNEPGPVDVEGSRIPLPTGERFVLAADSIIAAVGQAPDREIFSGRIALRRNGSVVNLTSGGRTSRAGLYSGGDLAEGPDCVVRACAAGVRAGKAICRELGLEEAGEMGPPPLSHEDIIRVRAARARRSAPRSEDARAEAARCLQCSSLCDKCVEVCPHRANVAYAVLPVSFDVPVVAMRGEELVPIGRERFAVSQPRQVVNVADLCCECGNCAAFCVHDGRPWREKPRLCLDGRDLDARDNGLWHIARGLVRRREKGGLMSLAVTERGYLYEDEDLTACLGHGFTLESLRAKRAFTGERSLLGAAEMRTVYEGIMSSAPWLAAPAVKQA